MIRDVAFSCDDNGTRFLEVAVWSLLEHYHSDMPLRINVFEGYGGHSERSKECLRAIIKDFNLRKSAKSADNTPGGASTDLISLRYHNVEEYLKPYAELILNREKSRWNVFTWTPIFTPQILADAEGTVIHFDIDMLFNADISELFEVKTPLIACTYEYDKYGDNAGRVIWEKGILPSTVERYFNTGVLVMNAEECRKERTWEKILAWYEANYAIADRIEQDAWNALYWNRMVPLHIKWNFHDRAIKNYVRWDSADKYWLGNPPRECLEAALDPSVLHFWGPKKPWKTSHRPYRRLYHTAMKAIGQQIPREGLLAVFHDFVNAFNLTRIISRLG